MVGNAVAVQVFICIALNSHNWGRILAMLPQWCLFQWTESGFCLLTAKIILQSTFILFPSCTYIAMMTIVVAGVWMWFSCDSTIVIKCVLNEYSIPQKCITLMWVNKKYILTKKSKLVNHRPCYRSLFNVGYQFAIYCSYFIKKM